MSNPYFSVLVFLAIFFAGLGTVCILRALQSNRIEYKKALAEILCRLTYIKNQGINK